MPPSRPPRAPAPDLLPARHLPHHRTAWFSTRSTRLADVRARLDPHGVRPVERQAGLLSSMSFLGSFPGASLAGSWPTATAASWSSRSADLLGSAAFGAPSPPDAGAGLRQAAARLRMGMEFRLRWRSSRRSSRPPSAGAKWPSSKAYGRWASSPRPAEPSPPLLVRLALGIPLSGGPALFVFVIRMYGPSRPAAGRARGATRNRPLMARSRPRRVATRRPRAAAGGDCPADGAGSLRRFSFLELWTGPYVRRTVMIWLLWSLPCSALRLTTGWARSAGGRLQRREVDLLHVLISLAACGFVAAPG